MRIILTVETKERSNQLIVDLPAIIGRDDACAVVVDDDSVSRRHLAVSWVEPAGDVVVEDLGSANGTWIDGQRIRRTVWQSSQPLLVGDVALSYATSESRQVPTTAPSADLDVSDIDIDGDVALVARYVRDTIAKRKASGSELADHIELLVREAIVANGVRQERQAQVFDACTAELLGYGPLQGLIADESVDEIMVNGPERVWVERRGKLEQTGVEFRDTDSLLAIIERMAMPLGRRIDEGSPMVDGRLSNGSRFHAVIPPIAIEGPCLTIRKFRDRSLDWDEMMQIGTLNAGIADWLRSAVRARRNIVVSGGTGSGKTTMLNLLASAIDAGERIVTIEDAAELRLEQPHVVRLESRPHNLEGTGAVSIRDLVRTSLRMRPDRIVVGECRGPEALDMLQAMNTGHDGSLTTVHANGTRDALARIETMAMMADVGLPHRVIRDQVARAIDIVVQLARMPDGHRRVTAISAVAGIEGDVVTLQDIAGWRPDAGFVLQGPIPPGFGVTR